jgi:sugar phosphate isomerase/epimerase
MDTWHRFTSAGTPADMAASGVIDARAFLTVLDEVGFDGPAFVEPFNAEVRALAQEERVAAVAASLENVRP